MHVIDLYGREYPLQATTNNDSETNGNQSLSATIYATKVNKPFISDIAEMWNIVDHDDVENKIIYCKRQGKGDLMTAEIKAIPLFFDTLDNDRIYDRIDKHMTAMEAFTMIFDDTGFQFVLSDTFDAAGWEGFGDGESKLETFKRALERYKAEFRISGNVIYLERQIGRDTQFRYEYKLNASNIIQEIDANEMWTYAKGYGNYGNEGQAEGNEGSADWEGAKLIREYTSPLSKVIGIRHAPPIKDGRITVTSQMDNQLKTLVDESLKISVSADIHDLRKQGYPIAQSEVGDRVFLIDSRIGLDDEVRVISQSLVRDWKGNVIDLNITFGNEKITKRHQSQLQTAVNSINELIAGRKKLPFSVLPEAKQNAIKALESAQTELIFGDAGNGVQGIIAQDKKDPNKLVWLNSAGWMISTDGGATAKVAATADGIVADVITAGILNTDQVAIMGGDGSSYTHIQGATMEMMGTYKLTWLGETETNTIKVIHKNGMLRFKNETDSNSTYFSFKGIHTFASGGDDEGESRSSGSLFLRDKRYSGGGGRMGVTTYSYGGAVSLVSYENNVILHPNSGDTSRLLRAVGSADGKNTYLMHADLVSGGGVESRGGIRFDESKKGIVEVVDKDYTTGGNTEIRAGYGNFNYVKNSGSVKISPYIDSWNKIFRFHSSGDGAWGYLTFGFDEGNMQGLRFQGTAVGHVAVVDKDNTTGADTVMEAGKGRFSILQKRENDNYIDIVTDSHFKVGEDSQGKRVASLAIYDRTTGSGANLNVNENGTLQRVSSSEKYKINIQKQFEDEKEQLTHSKKILDLDIVNWNDRTQCEITAEEITEGRRLSDDDFIIETYFGLTSERVFNAGLPELVEINHEGGLEGVDYSRGWLHLIPVTKDILKRLEKIERKLANGTTNSI